MADAIRGIHAEANGHGGNDQDNCDKAAYDPASILLPVGSQATDRPWRVAPLGPNALVTSRMATTPTAMMVIRER